MRASEYWKSMNLRGPVDHQVAQNEGRPSIADDVEGPRHRAIAGVVHAHGQLTLAWCAHGPVSPCSITQSLSLGELRLTLTSVDLKPAPTSGSSIGLLLLGAASLARADAPSFRGRVPCDSRGHSDRPVAGTAANRLLG
jgi:hypothetical protein